LPLCLHSVIFAEKTKKQLTMVQLSKLLSIFVVSSGEMGGRHRGELICFNPSVNLENSL